MDSGVLFHALYVTITNSQSQKREWSSSFTSILRAHSSKEIFVSDIVKKSAFNQSKNTNTVLTETLEIVLASKNLGLSEIGGPRHKPFKPNGKSAPESTPRFSLLQRIC